MKEQEKRKYPRERCYGKIFFLSSEIPGYIRDISSEGMRVDCPFPLSPMQGKTHLHPVKIFPEEEPDFLPFSASVEIRWVQRNDLYNTVGLLIKDIAPEAEKEYRKLLGLYTLHSSEEG